MKIAMKPLLGMLVGAVMAAGVMADQLVGATPFSGSAFGQQSDGNSAPYAQAFVAPSGTVLDAIRWWGFHTDNSMGSAFDNFVVTIDGVAQAGTLSVLSGATGFDEYTLDIVDVALTGSMLGIVNDSTDVEWFWQSSTAVGNAGAPDAAGVAFSLIGRQATFNVDEPASVGLALAALTMLGAAQRRRIG